MKQTFLGSSLNNEKKEVHFRGWTGDYRDRHETEADVCPPLQAPTLLSPLLGFHFSLFAYFSSTQLSKMN